MKKYLLLLLVIISYSAFCQCETTTDPYDKTVTKKSGLIRFHYDDKIEFAKVSMPGNDTAMYVAYFYHRSFGMKSIVIGKGAEFNFMLSDSSIVSGFALETEVGESKRSGNSYFTYATPIYEFKKADFEKLTSLGIIGFRSYFSNRVYEDSVKEKFKEDLIVGVKCVMK